MPSFTEGGKMLEKKSVIDEVVIGNVFVSERVEIRRRRNSRIFVLGIMPVMLCLLLWRGLVFMIVFMIVFMSVVIVER